MIIYFLCKQTKPKNKFKHETFINFFLINKLIIISEYVFYLRNCYIVLIRNFLDNSDVSRSRIDVALVDVARHQDVSRHAPVRSPLVAHDPIWASRGTGAVADEGHRVIDICRGTGRILEDSGAVHK